MFDALESDGLQIATTEASQKTAFFNRDQCGVAQPGCLQGQIAEPVCPLATDSQAGLQYVSSVTRHPHPYWAQVCPFCLTAVVVLMLHPPPDDGRTTCIRLSFAPGS
jgi:hypothetical protein